MLNRLLVKEASPGLVRVGFRRSGQEFDEASGEPVAFVPPFTEAEREDLRWYLEDYLAAPFAVYEQRGQAIQAKLPEWGRALFEQVFGSFQFGNETYLLEAKWHGQPTGVAELHTFHGKIEQRAAWTRGPFVGNSRFTDEGLRAFGRGKRVIYMDGLDLYETVDREIPLNDVLERKVRRAAETGSPFFRVRVLFPG